MRSSKAFLLALLVPLTVLAVPPADATTPTGKRTAVMRFTPKQQTVHLGDTYTVTVKIDTGANSINVMQYQAYTSGSTCIDITAVDPWSPAAENCIGGNAWFAASVSDPITGKGLITSTIELQATTLGTTTVGCAKPGHPGCYAVRASDAADILKRTVTASVTVVE